MENKIIDEDMIADIFSSNPKHEWKERILSYDHYTNKNGNLVIKNPEGVDDIVLEFSEEDLDGNFPYCIGDIVTHKELGGRFVIYGLPYLDEGRTYAHPELIGDYIILDPEFYDVIGYLDDGRLAGTMLDPKYGGVWLSEEQCHWKNWEKIGNLFMDMLIKMDFKSFMDLTEPTDDIKA